MKIRQIRTFTVVYEQGSFSRAASHANATQSGLSMHIHNLELELGVKLFERTSKGVAPTAAGQRFYRRANDILRRLHILENEAKQSGQQISGRITAGLLPAFTQSILAKTLVNFNEQHSDVEVAIQEGFSPVLSDAIMREDVDFAVVPIDKPHHGMRYEHFATDREVLVSNINSNLEHLQPVTPDELPHLNLVLPTKGNARRDHLDHILSIYGHRTGAILEMDSVAATLELVAYSDWMTILPGVICARDLTPRNRKLHPIASPRIEVDYMFVAKQTSVTPVGATLFLEALKTQYQHTAKLWQDAYTNF